MFDSFYIKMGDKWEEVQTKQLDCSLDIWYPGSTVEAQVVGLLSDVIVENRHTTPWQQEVVKDGYVAFIIFRGIYVDYIIADSSTEAADKGHTLLSKYIEESGDELEKTLATLRDMNAKYGTLKLRTYGALNGMDDVIRFLAGEDKIFNGHWVTKFRWKDIPEGDLTHEEKLEYLLKAITKKVLDNFPQYTPDYWMTHGFSDENE